MPMPKVDHETVADRIATTIRDLDPARLQRALRWLPEHELVHLDQVLTEVAGA